jgi:ComF family protein
MWHPVHVPRRDRVGDVRAATRLAVARVATAASALVAATVDLLLPPGCPGCRRPMGDDRGLCVDCWSTLRPIEEPWCERLGIPFPYDLGPGTLSAAAIADPPAFDRARSAVAYDGIAPDLVHAFKYADRTDLAGLIAAQMLRAGRDLLVECDAIVPVPMHRVRLFRRRFNQAALLAREIARRSGRPYRPLLLLRPRHTRQQVGLTREGRAENMRGAFAVPEPARREVRGRSILLVDDVLTTGATLEAAARVLKRAGAARVDVLTFARVVAS